MKENLIQEDNTSNNVEINSYEDFSIVNSFYGLSDYYTKDQLLRYVSNPMFYHRELMEVCEKMYDRNGQFGQTVTKMVSSPSLDLVTIPNNTTKKAKKNMDSAYNILTNKINHKLSTGDCMFNSLLYGEYVAILRDTKKTNVERPKEYANGKNIEGAGYVDNVMLQPLDLRYCRFEGFANGDYVVSYDMQYFDLFKGTGLVGEIKNYPTEFLRGYKEYKKDSSKKWMLLDQNTTFAYKYRAAINESHGRPLGMFALLDILFSEDYTNSQRNSMYENSSTIRWMELPEGEKKGYCSLNKDQQKNQYDAFKNAVKSADVNKNRLGGTTILKLAPGSTIGKLENDDGFLKDTLTEENTKSLSTSLGLSDAALNGGGQGINFSTLQINIDLMLAEVYAMLDQISFQYTKLLNNYLKASDENMVTVMYLHTSPLTSDKQFSMYKDLYNNASGSRIYLYSSACGNADLYMKLMEYEKSQDFDSKFTPHMTSYTVSDSGDKSNPDDNIGGKPKSKDSDLTPSGEITRQNNANNQPKPSTK